MKLIKRLVNAKVINKKFIQIIISDIHSGQIRNKYEKKKQLTPKC